MKYRVALLAFLVTALVGCATPRQNCAKCGVGNRPPVAHHNKDVKRNSHRSVDIGETVHVQERMRRIRIAVQEGKMTREEAAEKMKEFRGNISMENKPYSKKGKKDGTKIRSSKKRQQ